jgi:hypothetical protein
MALTLASNAITFTDNTSLSSGIIRNEQIASNAAIAGTKINPNFGSQDVVTSGKLLSPNGNAFFGTVSTSGNGAIMEYGSNANGYYIKYANGFVSCYGRYVINFLASTATAQELFVTYPTIVNSPLDQSTNVLITLVRDDYTLTTSKIIGFYGTPISETGFTARAWNLHSTLPGAHQRSFRFQASGVWYL